MFPLFASYVARDAEITSGQERQRTTYKQSTEVIHLELLSLQTYFQIFSVTEKVFI